MENTLENKAKFFGSHLGYEIEYPQIGNNKKAQIAILTGAGFEEIITTYKRKKKDVVGDILSWKSNGNHNSDAINAKLLFTPLSSITEEHAVEVAAIVTGALNGACVRKIHNRVDLIGTYSATLWHDGEIIYDDDDDEDRKPLIILQAYDYLRSKSYLLPYNGLSPEELISRGWAKLKTE